ncbi:hypothetical protein [Pseudoalteromonas sp. P1-8]|uniref:hypothetical protein n=1 Tax=Pseudoalteromonas sp. P1-8 TaxID=1710353 RepID=UPI0006DD35F3|nr:hypothetical protein [Pseudoalteromonas sp. P1-8]KPW03637.1 hypothetical protein AN213_00799 [Pseudoalteromonas sp. P1-8]
MDIITQLTSENGIFTIIGFLIGFVLEKLLTMSKIRKVNLECKKLLAQTKELEEKNARERESWEEANAAMFTAYSKITPARKSGKLPRNNFERLDDNSFFNVRVPITNLGHKRIILERVKFVGQEKFVDGGYGANKQNLEKIEKEMLTEGEVLIEPGERKEFNFDYCIGKRFNDRMEVDCLVTARVGNLPAIEKKFSEGLLYIY